MQRKLTFLAFFLICIDCAAQEYPFFYYTPKDGLVNSRIRGIKQDSKGRMLFITFGGLTVYDGTRFINYSKSDGLANEYVNDVTEEGPDSFLVATNTPLLNTLVRGRVGTYRTSDNYYPIVNRFFRSTNGNLYATADEGLFVLGAGKFTHLPLLWEGLDIGSSLDRIMEWKNYFLISLWNSERKQKLILYDWANKKVLDADTRTKVINCARDANGRIWISATEQLMLIDTLALLRGKIVYQPIPNGYNGLTQTNSYIYFDRDNNLWLYGRNGIRKISPTLQEQIFTTNQGSKSKNLDDLFLDREGIAWFATDGNGVMKIKNDNIELVTNLGNNQPASAITSQDDTVWILCNNTMYRIYENERKAFSLPGEKINSGTIYVHNQELFLSDASKLICIENKDREESYHHPKILLKYAAADVNLGTGLANEDGTVIQYAKRNDSVFLLLALTDQKVLSQHPISYMVDQMVTDSMHQLWLATRNDHLMVFGTHPDQPSKYLQLMKEFTKELPEMSPRCMAFDKEGNLWIGTRYSGVYRLTFNGLTLRSAMKFDTQNGLTDNFVYSVKCDSNNTIWVGTQTGLDRISAKNGQFIIGNVSKSNNFFQSIHRIIVTKNNTVWALTGEGSFLKVNPTIAKATLPIPQFLFTSLQVNNQPYADPSTIFTYKQNNLSFNVAAISFIDERAINYSYILEGSGNSNWSKASNNPGFNFVNLPPGNYDLKVKADFPEAIYPPQIISYSFIIRPPWWATWWFRVFLGLFIVACLIFAIRFYYKRKLERQKISLEKQQAIEKERTRIATDMHDDLGAGLSRIKFLSETIGIKKQKQLPFEDDITKIREYSHEMIDKMGEIVWALNEKNDSLSDLLSYTRSYTVEYLSQSGVACTIDAPEIFPANFVSGEFRRNVFLSVKEILHNIVKHSQANQVTISIQINHRLSIHILDDGIGFDRSKIRPYSNGLVNIEKRMKDIGGSMEMQNRNGTLVKLTIPLS